MPKFRVPGIGKKTGKQRNKTYYAASAEEAIEQAYADETIVDVAAIEQLPDEPPTDAQIQLGKDLNLDVPENPTREQMKVLIDASLNNPEGRRRYNNLPPTQKQLGFAKELSIKHAEQMTRKQLSREIDRKLEDEREKERVLS